jgi:predicted nucleic acid-binding protein
MSGKWFLDTNVLVYARDASEPGKQVQAAKWLAWLWSTRRGRVSTQVLNEYYVTVTRKLSRPIAPEDARQHVRSLRAWKPAAPDELTFEAAWAIEDRYGLSWWDSLIVAAARRAGCASLLTEDLQEGQDLDGVLVVNPFTTNPPL